MDRTNDTENTPNKIIQSAIQSLKTKNKRAYNLLNEHSAEGFFEIHKSQGRINALADELLKTIKSKGG